MAKTVNIGMIGYAFMGKAHSNAYRKITYMTWPPPLMPQLVAIAGRNEEAVAGAHRQHRRGGGSFVGRHHQPRGTGAPRRAIGGRSRRGAQRSRSAWTGDARPRVCRTPGARRGG